jgi:hypothetical protein
MEYCLWKVSRNIIYANHGQDERVQDLLRGLELIAWCLMTCREAAMRSMPIGVGSAL